MIHGEQPEVAVYYSPGKILYRLLLCVVMIMVSLFLAFNDSVQRLGAEFWGWIGIIFFGGAGLVVGVSLFYMLIRRIPYIKIFDDRMEYYVPMRMKYKTVYFRDVEGFRLINMSSKARLITIDYKPDIIGEEYEAEETSGLKKWLFSINYEYTGAIEAIQADVYKIDGEEICDILNERVQVFNDACGNNCVERD
ncbi:MAG: hypothetical protein K1W01_02535 [Muribaculaceae bacterium]